VRLGQAVNYRSAGTVEFVYDAASGEFYFLEVNTRLQVEHGVTEEVTGVDLVEWMIRQASGDLPSLHGVHIRPGGAAIQVRLYAEDPHKNFQPSAGLLTAARFPTDIRVDAWVGRRQRGAPQLRPHAGQAHHLRRHPRGRPHEADRRPGGQRGGGHRDQPGLPGQVLAYPDFVAGKQTTRMLESFHYRPATVDVLEPGVQSSLQDWPGRTGYWDVGVPPSGPMDSLSMRLANRLAGNPEGAAALELTAAGPTLKFNCDTVIALGGAAMAAKLDGAAIDHWRAYPVKAGAVLQLGRVEGAGLRAYLAVAGGFQAPDYLGSKSTFTLGQFGGHGGRTLRAGDVLHLPSPPALPPRGEGLGEREFVALSAEQSPPLTHVWEIGVLYGPHGAPDFFTPEDIDTFFATAWEVHYNSSRAPACA
jgi:urea carboxylase